MQTPPPVSSDPLREALEALIDIWDDGKHHPDNRAYVSGSFAAMIEEARATLTTTPSATEPALRSALERVTWCFRLLLSGKPVRDAAETLAEADAALSSRATEPDRNAAPEGWKLLKDTTQDERSWPEDYVDENGQYFNTCHNCLRVFLGYKRRGTCKVCATRTATKD